MRDLFSSGCLINLTSPCSGLLSIEVMLIIVKTQVIEMLFAADDHPVELID